MNKIIDVIIPAYNEEKSIGLVIDGIPKALVRNIIVCNNNSKDETKAIALKKGAIVVDQINPGYGNACLKGIEYVQFTEPKPDIIVFMDGDYSDHGDEMPYLVKPIIENDYDFVIGSRAKGNLEKGSMTPQQVFGNWLATTLIRIFLKAEFSDLGPYRAIKWNKLVEIDMKDKNFGWTVEMQLKAIKYKLKYTEVPVNYRRRIGISKVSGTIKGTIMAGYKILWTIYRYI